MLRQWVEDGCGLGRSTLRSRWATAQLRRSFHDEPCELGVAECRRIARARRRIVATVTAAALTLCFVAGAAASLRDWAERQVTITAPRP